MDTKHEDWTNFRGVALKAIRSFVCVDRRLWEPVCLLSPGMKTHTGMERPRNMQKPETEDLVLDWFGANSSTNTQKVTADISVCRHAVWRILREECIQPFHVLRMLKQWWLLTPSRVFYGIWMLQMRMNSLSFPNLVLFYDEAFLLNKTFLTFRMNTSALWVIPT